MGRLRTVNVCFQLAENQKVPFTVIDGGKLRVTNSLSNESEESFGYAADVALICLYVQEGSQIQYPTLSFSDVGEWQLDTALWGKHFDQRFPKSSCLISVCLPTTRWHIKSPNNVSSSDHYTLNRYPTPCPTKLSV